MNYARIAALGLVFSLAGCINAGLPDFMKGSIGQTDDKIYARLGAPNRTVSTQGGGSVATWDERNLYGRVLCTITFVISSEHVITSGSTTCPSSSF